MAAMLGFGSINLRVDFSEGWPPKKKIIRSMLVKKISLWWQMLSTLHIIAPEVMDAIEGMNDLSLDFLPKLITLP